MPPFHPLWLTVGLALLLFVLHDVIVTTLHRGGGPITRLMTGPLWRLLMRTRIRGLVSHRVMGLAGVALVLLTVGTWIALLWASWAMVFMGDLGAVVHAEDQTPANLAERIYFTGFTIFTLGVGDFVPTGPMYEIFTAIASLSGFFLVTFAVTYLMPVAQAAASKRALADRISALGADPGDMLARGWDGQRLSSLEDALSDLIADLAKTRQHHLAYPVLHFFHAGDPEQSLAVTITRLDEALWVAQAGSESPLIRPSTCGRWHEMVERLFETMGIDGEPVDAPPLPPLGGASAAGVPLVGERELSAKLEAARQARCGTAELVRAHGWDWDAVIGRDTARPRARRELLDQPVG